MIASKYRAKHNFSEFLKNYKACIYLLGSRSSCSYGCCSWCGGGRGRGCCGCCAGLCPLSLFLAAGNIGIGIIGDSRRNSSYRFYPRGIHVNPRVNPRSVFAPTTVTPGGYSVHNPRGVVAGLTEKRACSSVVNLFFKLVLGFAFT